MNYRYAPDDDRSHLAGGNILKHFSGAPCFPARMTIELLFRAKEYTNKDRLTFYDPCCGSAYSAAVTGLTGGFIKEVYVSDIDEKWVKAAEGNIGLLQKGGIDRAVEALINNDNTSDERKRQLLFSRDRLISEIDVLPEKTEIFRHDILSGAPEKLKNEIDYVFADIPYGSMTDWINNDGREAVPLLLDSIYDVLTISGVCAIAGTKELKIDDTRYRRRDRLSFGKRLIYILQKV